jgi:hypothetical protein
MYNESEVNRFGGLEVAIVVVDWVERERESRFNLCGRRRHRAARRHQSSVNASTQQHRRRTSIVLV